MADETYQVRDHHGVFRPGAEVLAWLRKATGAERFDAWKRTVLPRLTDEQLDGWVRRSDLTADQRLAVNIEVIARHARLAAPVIACPTCEGWGQILDGETGECPDCAGTGVTPAPPGHRPKDSQAPERGVVAPVVAATVIGTAVALAAAGALWERIQEARRGR